jgi:hypothetical protein
MTMRRSEMSLIYKMTCGVCGSNVDFECRLDSDGDLFIENARCDKCNDERRDLDEKADRLEKERDELQREVDAYESENR